MHEQSTALPSHKKPSRVTTTAHPVNLAAIRKQMLPIAREPIAEGLGSGSERADLACLVLKLADELQRMHKALRYARSLIPREVDNNRLDAALKRTTVARA